MSVNSATVKHSSWVVILMAVSVLGNFISSAVVLVEKTDKAQTDVTTVAEQVSDLRTAVKDGFVDVQAQIAGLPDQRAAITSLTRRANDADRHMSALDVRATTDEQQLYRVQTDVDGLKRAVGMPSSPP